MSYDRVRNSGNTTIYLNPSTLIKFLLRVLEKAPWGKLGIWAEMPMLSGNFNPVSYGAFKEEKDNMAGNQGMWWSGEVRWDTEETRGEELSSSY